MYTQTEITRARGFARGGWHTCHAASKGVPVGLEPYCEDGGDTGVDVDVDGDHIDVDVGECKNQVEEDMRC